MRQLFLPFLLCLTTYAGFAQTTSYCIPVYQYNNDYGYINSVQLGTIDNITGKNPTAPRSTSYTNYYSYTSAPAANQTTDLAQGSSQTIAIHVQGGNSINAVAAWIDFNADGDFSDPGELLGSVVNQLNTNVVFTFNVPHTAGLGPTRLRVRESYGRAVTDPCTFLDTNGETEDYTVNIVVPVVSCSGTLTLGNAVTSNAGPVCSATSFNLSVDPAPLASNIAYQWQVSTTGETGMFTDIAGKTDATTTITGQTQSSWYRLKSLCTSSGQSDFSGAVNVTQQVAANCYCIPSYQSYSRYAYISYVQLGTINRLGISDAVPNGYYNYTNATEDSLTTDLAPGSSQTITIFIGGNGYNTVAAWIDFNANGDFNDPGELLGSAVDRQPGEVHFTFTVPATAVQGPTRLRIRETVYGEIPDPCASPNNVYGETNDYTVNIVVPKPCSGTNVTYYRDTDGDGFGNPTVAKVACSSTPPSNYVTDNTDCDDTKTLYADNDRDGYGAGAPVGCGVANNTDCNDADVTVWQSGTLYVDKDGDGYDAGTQTVCQGATAPTGYSLTTNGLDCNDNDSDVHVSGQFYIDADGDGYGTGALQTVCYSGLGTPTNYSTNDTDCEDTDPQINPNTVWYLDADGDSYYTGTGVTSCTAPSAEYKYTGLLGENDCNDANATIYSSFNFYTDGDRDGYGMGSLMSVCAVNATTPPAGYSLNNTDCDDNDNSKWQSATLYIDNDGDGYDNGTTSVCYGATVPQGYSTTTQGSDCNDQDAAIHAQYSFYLDSDKDGYGAGSAVLVCAVDANTPPTGYSTNNTDCAPSDAAVWQNCTVVAPYTLSVSEALMNEGNKGRSNMTFMVTLDKASTKKITVQYKTQNGTAIAGGDYIAKSGTLTFKPGSTTQKVTIPVIGDKNIELNETFTVILSNPVNAGLSKATGTGMILNDDGTATTSTQAVDAKGVTQEVSRKLIVTVSPNPSRSYFTLHTQSGSNKPLQVKTVDALGRQIETRINVPANGTLMLGSHYHPGIYFTEVLQGKERITLKLIKQSN